MQRDMQKRAIRTYMKVEIILKRDHGYPKNVHYKKRKRLENPQICYTEYRCKRQEGTKEKVPVSETQTQACVYTQTQACVYTPFFKGEKERNLCPVLRMTLRESESSGITKKTLRHVTHFSGHLFKIIRKESF